VVSSITLEIGQARFLDEEGSFAAQEMGGQTHAVDSGASFSVQCSGGAVARIVLRTAVERAKPFSHDSTIALWEDERDKGMHCKLDIRV
jgi:hypothetical protein